MPPLGWILPPSPSTTTAQQSGEMGFPSLRPTRGSAPPKAAPTTAFPSLSVSIFGCFLIKAIWGLWSRQAQIQLL